MNTYQILSIGLLIGGVVLAIFGFMAADSFSSDVSNVFTGTPTDKSMWMIIGGIVLASVGLFGTLKSRGSRSKQH